MFVFLLFCTIGTLEAQENMRGSWMPNSSIKSEDKSTAEIDLFLKSLQGRIRPMVCNYNDVVLNSYTVFTEGTAQNKSSSWICEIQKVKVPEQSDAMDLTMRFRLKKGEMKSGGVAVAFDFSNWSTDNYVLAPAAVYNANRYRILPVHYPPFIYDKKDKPLNMPITITNVSHFNVDKSPAKIELLTGNCSSPILSFYDAKVKRGWIMLTTQGTRFGNSGFIIEENAPKKMATFVLSAPGVREMRYTMCGFSNSTDKSYNWKSGEDIELKFRLYNFTANDLQAFYEKVFTVRKALSGANVYRHRAPFSAITEIILDHTDDFKWYESEKFGYICNEPNGESPFGHLQAGWNGVPVYGYPQVLEATPERIRRVSRGFDALGYMQGKSGLIYGMMRRGELLGDNFSEMSKKPAIAMIRRSGEVLYFGIQTLEVYKKQGYGNVIKKEWEGMLKKMADGLVKLWKDYGQFGQFVDVETGKIDINGSTSGVICLSGLAIASGYFHNPEYLEIAKVAGRYYYTRDLSKGYTGGGPAEILQCQDSESAWDIAEAYTVLYEITGESEWLKYARESVAQLATWVVSYDYKFPKGSRMDIIDAKVTGSIVASIQNACSTPGLYILSGDFLLKLYRATGDQRYVELLKDLAHNVVQYTTTLTNPLIPYAEPGSVTERVNIGDWEGAENIGGNLPEGNSNLAWETVTLLTIMQNPGIYIRNDLGEMVVFDHVNAEIIKKDKNGVTLKVSNPTPYLAKVSVLSENGVQSKKPLGNYSFLNWPHMKVNAGESKIYFVGNNGKVDCLEK